MNSSKKKTKCTRQWRIFFLVVLMFLMLSLSFAQAGIVGGNADTQHFKIISSVEYDGNGQFKNRVESQLTLRKESLLNEKIRYLISTKDFDLAGGEQGASSEEVSFVIDRKNRRFSTESEGLELFEKLNNRCVKSLDKVSKANIGKTWKQSFDISFLGSSLPGEMRFTVTAIGLETDLFGEMIAVRALSEPFAFNAAQIDGSSGSVQAKVNSVYVFDPEIEDVYLSISVFEATTKMNGFKENLKREVATYMTNVAGISLDLSGLGNEFEKFVRKVGLTGKDLKVSEKAPLPNWAKFDGLRTSTVANMCSAMACEGGLNPVVSVCIPSTRVGALQGTGKLASMGNLGTVSATLAKSIPAVSSMKIAVAPAFLGVGLGTAGTVAGGTVGAVAVAGGFSSSSSSDATASN